MYSNNTDITVPMQAETLDELIALLQHIRADITANSGGPIDPSLKLAFACDYDPDVLEVVYDENNRIRLS
jgi:hypothetical protein